MLFYHIQAYNLNIIRFLQEYITQQLEHSPASIAERSKACTVFSRSNIEITASNPARGVDVCLRVSVLCSPVFR
jgi:hypothetical protein